MDKNAAKVVIFRPSRSRLGRVGMKVAKICSQQMQRLFGSGTNHLRNWQNRQLTHMKLMCELISALSSDMVLCARTTIINVLQYGPSAPSLPPSPHYLLLESSSMKCTYLQISQKIGNQPSCSTSKLSQCQRPVSL